MIEARFPRRTFLGGISPLIVTLVPTLPGVLESALRLIGPVSV